jgi:uncharacterized protein (TIGR03437 family)
MSYVESLSKRIRLRGIIPALFFCLSPAAFADLNLTTSLSTGQNLNLDTGAITSTGGDISFQGSSITFAANATNYVLGNIGAGGFALINEATLSATAPIYAKTAVSGSNLAVGVVFGVYTNATHYAKVLITAVSSTSLTIQFTTFGATAGVPAGGPTISRVQNNYSNIVAGLPNYGVAPSTLFVIYGTGLATPTAQAVLQSSASPGIPTTLNGATINVTVNGVTTHPGIYYAIATQIAAVLPANTPIGTGTVTVTYNNITSAPATMQVVQSALGLDTISGQPTGLGAVTDPFTGAIFNYTTSAKPGQLVTLWGSGLGADTADSDTIVTSAPHAVNVPLTMYIGGIQAQIQYAGSSGYPGLVQINVYVPTTVVPGCGVPIVGVVGTVVSNTITLPVAANGGVCNDPVHGVDGTGLLSGSTQTSLTSGTIAVAMNTTLKENVSSFTSASFLKETNIPYTAGYGLVTVGGCLTLNSTPPQPTISYLAAGNLSITGPGGTLQIPQVTSGSVISYELNLPTGYFPTSGGTFTIAATGSADVKPFSVTVSDPSPLVWTNQASITSVDRTQPLTVSWTGGIPGTYVQIGGGSTTINASATFLCIAPVEAGQFTIPSYVLLASPAANGGINLINQSNPVYFSISALGTTYAVAETESSISVPFK